MSYKQPNQYLKGIWSQMATGKIPCPENELDLGITLHGGQSFRWKVLEDRSYRGVFSSTGWTLSREGDHISYKVHGSLDENINYEESIKKYFRLNLSLEENLKLWAAADANFQNLLDSTKGVRMLDQDVVENAFSFICSSNNNIQRISGMVEKLCKFFGPKICEVDDTEYYDFPEIKCLTGPNIEETLRKEGFGYRANYVAKTARQLMDLGGREWLLNLHKNKNVSYSEARAKLMTLQGIGPKVADCICLMSLGHLEAIPVDTHIFQVAHLKYLPHLAERKNVTPKIHEEVSNHLRSLWGPLAGWAQAVVFCAKINDNILSTNVKRTCNKRRVTKDVSDVAKNKKKQ